MKNMRQICRILLWVAEQPKPVDIYQVMEALDLAYDQAKASIRQLVVKQKLIRHDGNGGRNLYEYNEAYEPPDRPKIVRCQSPVAKALERRAPVSFASAFKFADKKINLLRRLQDRCAENDADLIEGIIRDYESVYVRKRA